MVVDGYSVGFLYLVDEYMSGAKNSFKENGWDGHVGLSDTHLYLQLVDNVICHVNDFFEHCDLLLIAYHANLCTLEKEIGCVSGVNIEVDLCADFLKQYKIAFENELHLDLV
jgi:hypothetical protein